MNHIFIPVLERKPGFKEQVQHLRVAELLHYINDVFDIRKRAPAGLALFEK
jgi:hypothetical protein